ncbi:MAG: DUF1828 domain-containing protein [Phycisphaerae bacterium]
MNAIEDFASQLCPDLVLDVAVHDDQSYIITRFMYPDGDTVNLYVDAIEGRTRVSDMGTTLSKFREMGITVTSTRKDFIRAICDIQGVDFDTQGLCFRKVLEPDALGIGCIAFCEAIAKISNLQYEQASRTRSSFLETLDGVVSSRIEIPKLCTVVRDWNDPEIDPSGQFRVDYKFNGTAPPRLLFGVGSTSKALRAVETYAFFLKKNRMRSTLAVLDEEGVLGTDAQNRLEQLMPTLVGVAGNEDRIAKFAVGGEI